MQDGYIILADGQIFGGKRWGAQTDAVGELVFTTAMTGYLETLTDPSYWGHTVIQTFPLIGNYGVIPEDFESARCHMKAYITHEVCDTPSNFRSQGNLHDWLCAQGVPALSGVDTRCLTRLVREQGTINAILSSTPTLSEEQQQTLLSYKVQNAVQNVSSKTTFSSGDGPLRVVLYDFGAKANIARELQARGCQVITVPAATPAAEALAHKPHGILLSNGPGDPAENTATIRQISFLCQSGVPLFGICLGHQLMALAGGARTRKMKYGHRGANQPAQNLETGRTYITSQNHGYCVVAESLPKDASPLYQNVNDGTCEGVRYQNFPGFSVQFHPEACGGPLDTAFLFDDFITLMQEEATHAHR